MISIQFKALISAPMTNAKTSLGKALGLGHYENKGYPTAEDGTHFLVMPSTVEFLEPCEA
jgi:hypothetical protein